MGEPARQGMRQALKAYGHSGREAAPGRRRGRVARRLAAGLAAALVLLPVVPAGAATAGGARPAAEAEASAEYPVVMTVESVAVGVAPDAPPAASPNDVVTITGHVTNAGRSVLKGAHAGVRQPANNRPLTARSELASVASRGNPGSNDGYALDSPQHAIGELGPGQSQEYTLGVSAKDLGLAGKEGVFELAVDVWGSTADNQRERALGIARTFLPYNPSPAEAQPLRTATLWPLVHTPVLAAQTYSENDQNMPVLRNDGLAAEFAPNGRLYELVDIGAKLPGLTWVIDPDLLDTAYAMTRQYRVQKPGTDGQSAKEDNTVLGTGQAAAAAWLEKLRAAVAKQGSEVVALPYADPDLASIAHNGADLTGMDTALLQAGTAGRLTVEGRLGVDARSDTAWPYQGLLDQQIAATAQRGGANLVLANGASLPESGALKYTPTAPRPIGNGQTAVVADPTVSALFGGDLADPQAQTLAVQRFLAETFVISRQEPQNQRGLLVMPPRELTVSTAKVLARALQTAQAGKWVEQVGLDTVAKGGPDGRANGSVPAAIDYPAPARSSELPSSALTRTIGVQSELDKLMRVLTLPERVRGPFSAAMVRSMSTAWRGRPPAGDEFRKGVSVYLHGLVDAVKVPKKSEITFPGDSGIMQVSVRNDLTQTVTNLELRLTSSQPNRLRVGPAEQIVLPASQGVTLRFPVEAHNNGPVTMTAQLWTTGPDPQPYSDPVVFTAEVTSVTNGVLYVFGGGLVLFLLAALRFQRQRKRRGDEPLEDPDAPLAPEPADDPDTGADPAAAGAAEGEPEPDAADDDAAGQDGPERAGAAQTPRGRAADGRDRATGDEKVGP
ncbi:DUF6049 family protein [Kitasatospora sp. NPDC054939]